MVLSRSMISYSGTQSTAKFNFYFNYKASMLSCSSFVSVLSTCCTVEPIIKLAPNACTHGRYGSIPTSNISFERIHRSRHFVRASFGDAADDSTDVFPRISVRDPYKRLGISREASQEEIQAARNFLVQRYAGHKASLDAIESAHDKIIMQSLLDRRKPKIDFSKKLREVRQSHAITTITSRFGSPGIKFILKTTLAFVVLGILTIWFPTEDGPTLQVAISLVVSIYFFNERLRSRTRAILYGFGSFFASWLLGTFLMVSLIPPLLKGPRSFEVSSSIISYLFLWLSSTYLK